MMSRDASSDDVTQLGSQSVEGSTDGKAVQTSFLATLERQCKQVSRVLATVECRYRQGDNPCLCPDFLSVSAWKQIAQSVNWFCMLRLKRMPAITAPLIQGPSPQGKTEQH